MQSAIPCCSSYWSFHDPDPVPQIRKHMHPETEATRKLMSAKSYKFLGRFPFEFPFALFSNTLRLWASPNYQSLLCVTHMIRKSNPEGWQRLNFVIRKCLNFTCFCSKHAKAQFRNFHGLHDVNLTNKFGFFTSIHLPSKMLRKTLVPAARRTHTHTHTQPQ